MIIVAVIVIRCVAIRAKYTEILPNLSFINEDPAQWSTFRAHHSSICRQLLH